MRRSRMSLVAGMLGLTIGICSSCSKSNPATPSDAGTPVSIVSGSSTLTTTAYSPNPVTISPGGTVTWKNNDTTAHTSTGNDGSWDSGTIAAGASFSRTFPNAGTFNYRCTLHPGMVGTVTVR